MLISIITLILLLVLIRQVYDFITDADKFITRLIHRYSKPRADYYKLVE